MCFQTLSSKGTRARDAREMEIFLYELIRLASLKSEFLTTTNKPLLLTLLRPNLHGNLRNQQRLATLRLKKQVPYPCEQTIMLLRLSAWNEQINEVCISEQVVLLPTSCGKQELLSQREGGCYPLRLVDLLLICLTNRYNFIFREWKSRL